MKKVMIIGGGDWQVPITKKAKDMGFYVISSNLYPNSPAFAYADVGEVADVLDRKTNLRYAQKYCPSAVITDQSDIAVPTVAYLCEQLGLPGIGSQFAKLFTNKHEMRKFCLQHGFASPDFQLCREIDQAKAFLQKHHKIIIKPVDSQSSRGVFTLETPQQLETLFAQSMEYSNGEKAVLAEEYIEGTEFTVDSLKTPEGHTVLAISEKKHYAENPNVASQLFFSHSNNRFDYDLLRSTHSHLVMAMGLPFGLTHAEYKYMDGQFYLIEIAARGGGTKISSDIVPIMSGVDSNEMLIRMALGEKVPLPRPQTTQRCAVLKFLHFEPGVVDDIQGLEQIRRMEGVVDIAMNFRKGQAIAPMRDDRSRQGYYIAYGPNQETLVELQNRVERTLHILYR